MLLMIWVVCILAGAAIGARKGQPIGGAILGFVGGPIGVVIALVVGNDNKKCHRCAEFVKKDAAICKHCGAAV